MAKRWRKTIVSDLIKKTAVSNFFTVLTVDAWASKNIFEKPLYFDWKWKFFNKCSNVWQHSWANFQVLEKTQKYRFHRLLKELYFTFFRRNWLCLWIIKTFTLTIMNKDVADIQKWKDKSNQTSFQMGFQLLNFTGKQS